MERKFSSKLVSAHCFKCSHSTFTSLIYPFTLAAPGFPLAYPFSLSLFVNLSFVLQTKVLVAEGEREEDRSYNSGIVLNA